MRAHSFALILGITIFQASVEAQTTTFWNRLGSAGEVSASQIGPDLVPSGVGLAGHPADGARGGALTLAPGSYFNQQHVLNRILPGADTVIDAERGTIDAWYRQHEDPQDFSHGIYRIFDGPFGAGVGVGLYAGTLNLNDPPGNARLQFRVHFGGTTVNVHSVHDGDRGVNSSPYNGKWIHVRGVWDRAGIHGSSDTVRLYVNGWLAATATATSWGSFVGSQADIGGGNDANIAGKFDVDEVRVWDGPLQDNSGSDEGVDLVLGVDGADSNDLVKLASTGQTIDVAMSSAVPTFVGAVPMLLFELIWVTPPASPAGFPELKVNPCCLGILFDGTFPLTTLGLGGVTVTAPVPAGLTDITVRVQGLALSSSAANGWFATTPAHDMVIR